MIQESVMPQVNCGPLLSLNSVLRTSFVLRNLSLLPWDWFSLTCGLILSIFWVFLLCNLPRLPWFPTRSLSAAHLPPPVHFHCFTRKLHANTCFFRCLFMFISLLVSFLRVHQLYSTSEDVTLVTMQLQRLPNFILICLSFSYSKKKT